MKITFNFPTVNKGGKGSGNFDHSGRPGQVGGSGAGSGAGVAYSSMDEFVRDVENVLSDTFPVSEYDNAEDVWYRKVLKSGSTVYTRRVGYSKPEANKFYQSMINDMGNKFGQFTKATDFAENKIGANTIRILSPQRYNTQRPWEVVIRIR